MYFFRPAGSLRFTILNDVLVLTCKLRKPNYCFVVKGEYVTEVSINRIKKQGVVTIFWQVDPIFDEKIWPVIDSAGRAYNLLVTCEPGSIILRLRKLGFKNIAYMLGAVDKQSMQLMQNVPKKYDVSLVGTYHPIRAKYLESLRGLDVHIWGWGPWNKSSVADMFEGSSLSHKQMLKIYSQSKVIVDINRNPESTIPTNLRPFETAQVGGFILIRCKPNLHKVFKIGKEIDCFNSPSELRNKVEYYLNHPYQRQKIAAAMFQRIMKDHTYTKRISELFALIEKTNFG